MITKDIIATLHYFAFFKYAPTLEELHTFLKIKISATNLQIELNKLVKKRVVDTYRIDKSLPDRYTVGEYPNKTKRLTFNVQRLRKRYKISRVKYRKVQFFVKILSLFPQIRLIGLSGSVAMMNANEEDDIDLFIITVSERLWTGRFIAVMISELMGLRRRYGDKKARDKICLNLFFDEKKLKIPIFKQTEYVAHEVLQLKPLVDKNDTYKRFLDINEWVYDIFPNAQKKRYLKRSTFNVQRLMLADRIEELLKELQLRSINKHKTSELITDTQLWFFPDDFEKKLKR